MIEQNVWIATGVTIHRRRYRRRQFSDRAQEPVVTKDVPPNKLPWRLYPLKGIYVRSRKTPAHKFRLKDTKGRFRVTASPPKADMPVRS